MRTTCLFQPTRHYDFPIRYEVNQRMWVSVMPSVLLSLFQTASNLHAAKKLVCPDNCNIVSEEDHHRGSGYLFFDFKCWWSSSSIPSFSLKLLQSSLDFSSVDIFWFFFSPPRIESKFPFLYNLTL